jgi:hypothetical protein
MNDQGESKLIIIIFLIIMFLFIVFVVVLGINPGNKISINGITKKLPTLW